MTQFLTSGCYTMLLMPGFIQDYNPVFQQFTYKIEKGAFFANFWWREIIRRVGGCILRYMIFFQDTFIKDFVCTTFIPMLILVLDLGIFPEVEYDLPIFCANFFSNSVVNGSSRSLASTPFAFFEAQVRFHSFSFTITLIKIVITLVPLKGTSRCLCRTFRSVLQGNFCLLMRMKNNEMPVSYIQKYIARKFLLANEDESQVKSGPASGVIKTKVAAQQGSYLADCFNRMENCEKTLKVLSDSEVKVATHSILSGTNIWDNFHHWVGSKQQLFFLEIECL